MHSTDGDWEENRKFVLSALDALEERMQRDFDRHMQNDERLADELNTTLRTMAAEIASLKVQAGVWGLAAGAIPALLTIAYLLIQSHYK